MAIVGGVTDEDLLIAGILHDTIEDTDTAPEDIEALYGSIVPNYVLEVSDDKSLPKAERKRLQIEHAGSLSHGAKQLKLADRIANLRSVAEDPPKNWSAERQREYFDWSYQVYEGLRGANQKLEELFLKTFSDGLAKVERRAKMSNQ